MRSWQATQTLVFEIQFMETIPFKQQFIKKYFGFNGTSIAHKDREAQLILSFMLTLGAREHGTTGLVFY